MATQIGIVKALFGTATATAADGTIRNLKIGDQVFADEIILTGTDGAIEIEFADGSVMDLGRDSQALLDNAVFNPEAVVETAVTTDSDADAIQAAILAGVDPTQVTEATAAGAGTQADGNEGHQPVVIDYLAPQVTPTSGFDTTGISVAFPEIIDELQAPVEETPIEAVPNVSVSVAVDVEIGNPNPGDNEDDVILIPGGTVVPLGVSAVNIPEGTSNGGSHPVSFLITLSQVSTQPVSLHYMVNPGTAVNPSDYFDGALQGDVVIPPGFQGFIVTVYINEDHLDEMDETFSIVLSDVVGATLLNDTATVTIIDDDTTPVAQDDFNAVTEDGGEGLPETSGNVISGANDAGNNPAAQQDTDEDGDSLVIVSFSDADENVAAGGTITGEYGELTLNADGSYTYVLTTNDSDIIQGLSEGETLTDVFSYVVTDTYNAEQTADLTIVIQGADDGVTLRGLDAEGAEELVYEANLVNGSDPDSPALTQPGSFDFDAPDGFGDTGSVSVGGQSFTLSDLQALAGDNVDIPSSYGVLTLTGFTGDEFGGSISYEYTLTGNVDNDSQAGADDFGFTDSFAVVVTDDDGSFANGSLDVQIVDDTPTANDDGPTGVTEDGTSYIEGNVLDNDDANADQVAAFVSWGSNQANLDAIAALNTYGSLVQNGDGTWNYTLDNTDADTQALTAADNLSYDLTYIMADADGDQSPAKLTITITGADDSASVVTAQAQGPDATVYEAGLNPDGSDALSDSETVAGSFTVSATDGILNVVIGGTLFTLAQVQAFDGSQTVGTGEGTLTLTGYTGDAMSGTIGYSYTLDATIDNDSKVPVGDDAVTLAHFDDSVESSVNGVGVSTASDDLVIRAIDDIPTVSYVESTVVDNVATTFIGDWIYTAGADNLAVSGINVSLLNNPDLIDHWSTVDAGSDTVLTAYLDAGETEIFFILTMKADGTYSFELVNPNPSTTVTETVSLLGSVGGNSAALYAEQIADAKGNPDPVTDIKFTSHLGWTNGSNLGSVTTVNTNNNGIGAGSGAGGLRVTGTESLTLAFLVGDADTDGGTHPTDPKGVESVKLTFDVTKGDGTVNLHIITYDINGVVINQFDSSVADGGTVSISNPGGEDIYSIAVVNSDLDGGQFFISGSETTVSETTLPDDLKLDFNVEVIDGDGDSSNYDFSVAIDTDGALTGTIADDAILGTSGDDILIGGLGDDLLTGDLGSDQFVWVNGDSGTDTITDFNAGEGDVLNLADLLDPTTLLDIGGADNLDDYLKANFDIDTSTTTIDVYTGGDANAAGTIAQSIIINGDVTDLNTLLGNNNLIVDQ